MASTYTVAGIELITQGEQAGAWGNTTNTNWELIEEMVGGVASVALSTTSESLSVTDGASSDARHAAVVFTGSPGGTCTVTVSPNDMQKIYFIINNSDETVSMTQGSGANVSIPAGSKKIVYCDGAGAGAAVVDLTTNLDISGLHLGGTEVTATATQLNYVDATSSIQTQLDAKQASATAVTTSTNFGGDVSGTYNAIVVADDSHNHIISNVDGLQTALDAKAALAGATFTGAVTGTDLTLSGDLTVNGTTTTVNSTNTVVSDALIELANGTTGTPANDAGLVIERGDSNNAFIGFDESADKFIVGTGTFTGASTGDLTITTGTLVANIEGNVTGAVTGNADTATTLETARTIGGVSFNGSANIDLPGVNTTGNQDTSGNAATATKWATGRTISLTGDVTGTSGAFDGSGNLSFATTIAANSVALGTDTTGNYVASITNGSYITGGNGGSEGAGLTLAVDATSANTASKVVARDASGNFSAGTITAALSGNASTASAWASTRTIGMSGDVSSDAVNIDGSGNITITNTVVADDSHNHVISNVDGLQTALDAKAAIAGQTFTGAVYFGANNFGGDSGDYLKYTADTQLDVYVNGSNEFRFEADGDFHADGDVIAYSTTTASDERLKENIQVVEGAVDKCKALRGVTFDWKRDGAASAGVIAQDVQEVLPEAVKQVTGMNGEDHLTVNYGALTSILIEAVKELSAKVEELEAKLG